MKSFECECVMSHATESYLFPWPVLDARQQLSDLLQEPTILTLNLKHVAIN